MRSLALVLIVSTSCFAQTTTPPRIQTADPSSLRSAGGYLDVCGRKDSQISKESVDAVSKAPTGEVVTTIEKAMAANFADHSLCLGYLVGLVEGWREGHEHGVLAAQFPAGVPRDLSAAFKSMSEKELQTVSAAFKNDVPCLPDNVTFGQLQEAVIKYIRDQVLPNPLLRLVTASRMLAPALRSAFPCQADDKTKKPTKETVPNSAPPLGTKP